MVRVVKGPFTLRETSRSHQLCPRYRCVIDVNGNVIFMVSSVNGPLSSYSVFCLGYKTFTVFCKSVLLGRMAL